MSRESSRSSNLSSYSPFSLSFLPCSTRITLAPSFWWEYDTESPRWAVNHLAELGEQGGSMAPGLGGKAVTAPGMGPQAPCHLPQGSSCFIHVSSDPAQQSSLGSGCGDNCEQPCLVLQQLWAALSLSSSPALILLPCCSSPYLTDRINHPDHGPASPLRTCFLTTDVPGNGRSVADLHGSPCTCSSWWETFPPEGDRPSKPLKTSSWKGFLRALC